MNAVIRSIQVGRPRSYRKFEGKPWRSAIRKSAVEGAIFVNAANLAGDRQADLVHHGGADKAVSAYSSDHFPFWQQEFPQWQPDGGAFGENLTVEGLVEADVCIGDIFEAGSCLLQVSQPRQPCWKLSRKWNLPDLAARVQATGRTGWYLRVLQEGWVEAGVPIRQVERPHPELTIAWANRVMYARPRRDADDQKLAACPALSDAWRNQLLRRAGQTSSGR
jgi:MOSC domain-containing protein YiiM